MPAVFHAENDCADVRLDSQDDQAAPGGATLLAKRRCHAVSQGQRSGRCNTIFRAEDASEYLVF